MPNHCTNSVTVKSPDKKHDVMAIAAMLADFDLIIPSPSPEEFDGAVEKHFDDVMTFGMSTFGAPARIWWENLRQPLTLEESTVLIRKTLEESTALIAKYGCLSFVEWRCANWGTKWNAYYVGAVSGTEDAAQICFITAWGPPSPVLQELADKYPGIEIVNRWYDEGPGSSGDDGTDTYVATPGAKRKRHDEAKMVEVLISADGEFHELGRITGATVA